MAIPKLVHLWKMKVKGELRRLGRGWGLGTYSFNFPGTIENMMQKYLMGDLKTTTSSNFLTSNFSNHLILANPKAEHTMYVLRSSCGLIVVD